MPHHVLSPDTASCIPAAPEATVERLRALAHLLGRMAARESLAHSPTLLTIPQVAERLQVSDKTIRRWIAAGDLPTVRLGRQLRIQPQDFDIFLRQRWTS